MLQIDSTALLLAGLFSLGPITVHSADFSQFESIRNNIRLEGQQSMPGYIAFGDGDGNIMGYLWMSQGKGLVWATAAKSSSFPGIADSGSSEPDGVGAINLRDTQLIESYGVPISAEWTGTIADGVLY